MHARRHPLLIYTALYNSWRNAALLICLGSAVLWWFAPAPLDGFVPQVSLLTASIVAGLLFLYTLIGQRLTYVQCLPTYLRVSTPFYRLAVSYSRIRLTRPVLFDPPKVRWSQRWLVQPFRGQTALAVELLGLPVARTWLRLWLNDFVLSDSFLGLLFLISDWMTLSREIELYRTNWKESQRSAQRVDPITSLAPRGY